MPFSWSEGWRWRLGLPLISLALLLWEVLLSSPEALAFQEEKGFLNSEAWLEHKCLELCALAHWKWKRVHHSRSRVAQILMFFVLFWQNQLLAKGLFFVEEKIKLCEGKYKTALIDWGLCDSAFDVWTAEMLLSRSDRLQASDSPCPFPSYLGGSTFIWVTCSQHCKSELCFRKM